MTARIIALVAAIAALTPAFAAAQTTLDTVYVNNDVRNSPGSAGRYLLATPPSASQPYLTDACFTQQGGSYSLAHFDGAWHMIDAANCDLFAMNMPNRLQAGHVLDIAGEGVAYTVDCEPAEVTINGINSWTGGNNPDGDYTRAAVFGDSHEACYNHDLHPISLANFYGTWTVINAPNCDTQAASVQVAVTTNNSCDPTRGTWLVTLR